MLLPITHRITFLRTYPQIMAINGFHKPSSRNQISICPSVTLQMIIPLKGGGPLYLAYPAPCKETKGAENRPVLSLRNPVLEEVVYA